MNNQSSRSRVIHDMNEMKSSVSIGSKIKDLISIESGEIAIAE
jgi:hypothetical protein